MRGHQGQGQGGNYVMWVWCNAILVYRLYLTLKYNKILVLNTKYQ